MSPAPPRIFDRAARRLRRDRVARGGGSPLEQEIAGELDARLAAVTRSFATALVINSGAGHMASVLRSRGIAVTETDHGSDYAAPAGTILCDEDRLNVTPGSFDLVVMPMGLDTIDDVPGALIAARRALQPGGLFLACLVGAPTLPVLRDLIGQTDAADGRAIARLHPQIDVRAAGDLLSRAGFALPVADTVPLSLAYPSFDRLRRDLRSTGLGNVLAERHAVSRRWRDALASGFSERLGNDGRLVETVTLLFLTGWAPEPVAPVR